ncbi:hypothetical protein [uncultured Roseibium sp.]|uniref:hypothetical protein n=1 Tax=uncultured Roseibium sp. TaxID=1936171 RepID=UPI002633D8B4|nr:hypothetical protein [uncultured Roseibium sp.]
MKSPSKFALFVYPTFVVITVMAGVFMLGPGAVMTLGFLIGIITIPLAFIVGTIPTVGLTLALSLPFYYIQIYAWPAKTARNIILSILLGLGLSAAICQLMAIYLTLKANTFTSADLVQSPDFSGKSVFVIGARRIDKCGDVCELLIFLAGVRRVTISEGPVESELPTEFKGNTFELLPTSVDSCEYSTRGIASNLRTYFAENGRCVKKVEDDAITPDLILVTGDKNKSVQDIWASGFNPFMEAIYADRTSIFALVDGRASKVFQFTAVSAFPPAPILAPFSIAKGSHTSVEGGFFRRRIEIQEMPALENLFLSEQQLSEARSVLQSPGNKDQILELLKKGQLTKQQRSLVWSYVDGVVLKGRDRSPAAFEIAGNFIASGEFASHKIAPDLIEALRPDTNEQWSVLSNSLFAVTRHYTDIAHSEGLLKVRGSLKSIGREIANLPPDQLLKHKNQLATLAKDPLTINTTSSAFASVTTLGKEAFPILRAVFRSSKTAFETSDAARYSSFRIWRTPSYRTAVVALCKLAEAGKIDGAAIHKLLDDEAVAGDLTFLKTVALTDFDDFDRLSNLQNEAYILSSSPKEIIIENREKYPDKPCS